MDHVWWELFVILWEIRKQCYEVGVGSIPVCYTPILMIIVA
jgi:hypothetical protein